jgi:hypothetical protein
MKRSGFARKQYLRQSAPLVPLAEPARATLLRRADGKDGAVVAIPKGPKAKTGKRTPNAAEAAWIARILEYCCIACRIQYGDSIRTPAEVHHILRGGQRIGHLFTLPLCTTHHRGGPFARHPYRARFEKQYGTEMELLERLQAELPPRQRKFDSAEHIA